MKERPGGSVTIMQTMGGSQHLTRGRHCEPLVARLRSRWVVPIAPLASLNRVPVFVIQLPCDGGESPGPRIPIAFS